jgi:hypothetical protein
MNYLLRGERHNATASANSALSTRTACTASKAPGAIVSRGRIRNIPVEQPNRDDGHQLHPIVLVEVMGEDAEAPQGYYRNAFDWQTLPSGPGYAMARPGEVGGIDGGVGHLLKETRATSASTWRSGTSRRRWARSRALVGAEWWDPWTCPTARAWRCSPTPRAMLWASSRLHRDIAEATDRTEGGLFRRLRRLRHRSVSRALGLVFRKCLFCEIRISRMYWIIDLFGLVGSQLVPAVSLTDRCRLHTLGENWWVACDRCQRQKSGRTVMAHPRHCQ